MERRELDEMTDSEKLDELLTMIRALADAMEQMGQNPMMRALIPGGLNL